MFSVQNGDYLDQVIEDWNREMPAMETIGLATIGRIFAIYKHLEDSVDHVLREHGLPLWGFDVLFALRRQGPPYSLTLNDIAQTDKRIALMIIGLERLVTSESRAWRSRPVHIGFSRRTSRR